MHHVLKFLFAVIIIFFYAILSIIAGLLAIILGGLAKLMPFISWHRVMMKIALKVPMFWASLSNQFLILPRIHQWKIKGKALISNKEWYVLISNHQTWLDILVLNRVFNRKIPVIKFFMKKELLWGLPILGLSCWILDYPFLRRHSPKKDKDIYTIKQACRKFKELPTTVANFVEGTRFTLEKLQRQHSPYLYLLKPKAGGTAMVIKELQKKLSGVLNVAIHYSRPLTFWKYFNGDSCKITVHYKLLPLTPDLIGDYYKDREFRRHFQKWINSIWQRKDILLNKLSRTND